MTGPTENKRFPRLYAHCVNAVVKRETTVIGVESGESICVSADVELKLLVVMTAESV